MPSRKLELIIVPSPSKALSLMANVAASSPAGRITGLNGSSYFFAKSRSRWSPEGQPKMAPVP